MPAKQRHSRGDDGKYHIAGHSYELLEGSRAQVWHRTAYRTSGGLRHGDLTQNDQGRIVSAKKSRRAKKENRLAKHGWTAKKGQFGAVRLADAKKKSQKKRGGRKSRSRRR